MTSAAVPVLRTPRLSLRPLERTDAPALVAGVGNFDVSKWLAVVPYPYDERHALDFIEEVRSAGKPVWGIDPGSGVVGVIGIDPQLGYWLARSAWGKGIAFEAAEAILTHWFATTDAKMVMSSYLTGNDRSARLLGALGFREIGIIERPARALSQTVTAHEMELTRVDWHRRSMSGGTAT